MLIRGNGSPRSFRIRIRAIKRALIGLSFLISLSLGIALFFAGVYLVRGVQSLPSPPKAQVAEEAPKKEGIWNSVSGMLDKKVVSDEETLRELSGLRDDLARAQAKLESRQNLANGSGAGLLQFFGPHSSLMAPTESFMEIKNSRIFREGDKFVVDFELHNTDPQQRQIRGYILVLAKSADFIMVYPENAFSPKDNILVNFTKGETFGVSRFRTGRATFLAAPLEGKKPNFQIVLFNMDGKVLATQHVENQQ